MSHMVIFESPDGSTGQQHCDDLDGAVGYVESLRNDQGIERARIFRLEEVNFEITPYYVVSVADHNGAAAAPATAAPAPAEPIIETLVGEEPVAESNPFAEPEGDPLAQPEGDPFVPAEGDPFAQAEGDPFAQPAGDLFPATEAEAANPFGEPNELVAQVEAEVPSVPAVEEPVVEESGRRGLFGR